jgi:hypothetical protein
VAQVDGFIYTGKRLCECTQWSSQLGLAANKTVQKEAADEKIVSGHSPNAIYWLIKQLLLQTKLRKHRAVRGNKNDTVSMNYCISQIRTLFQKFIK